MPSPSAPAERGFRNQRYPLEYHSVNVPGRHCRTLAQEARLSPEH